LKGGKRREDEELVRGKRLRRGKENIAKNLEKYDQHKSFFRDRRGATREKGIVTILDLEK